MKRDEFHQLILNELQDVKREIKEVRVSDIPAIQISVAGFRKEIDNLKTSQKWSTRLYTVLGGAIAVAVSKFTGHQ